MDTKFDFGEGNSANTVYIRKIATSTLPEEVREQVPDLDTMYAVHDADGSPRHRGCLRVSPRRPVVPQRSRHLCSIRSTMDFVDATMHRFFL